MNNKSSEIFKKSEIYLPGGVNSPVRAFKSVNMTPIVIKRGEGAYIYDVDNNKYIDYVQSWGPMILGHNNKKVLEETKKAMEMGLSFGACTEIEEKFAELICKNIPYIHKIRMVNSGTEAVMSAIRLSRAYTERSKILKFEGCYHGHSDSLLVAGGSGVMTYNIRENNGITEGTYNDTLVAQYNDLDEVARIFEDNKNQIAAVVVEPIPCNMGVVLPKNDFLQKLRNLCNKSKTLLIFDEVITGFRIGFEGASGYFKVEPDLVTYGKIIGAGLPVGAFGGKKEIMNKLAPLGNVYQAGTLSGNPITMTAGYTLCKILLENKEVYKDLENKGNYFFNEIKEIFKRKQLPYKVNNIASLGSIFFTEKDVNNYNDSLMSKNEVFIEYFAKMIQEKIYIAPSRFEAMFISASHNKEDLDHTLEIINSHF